MSNFQNEPLRPNSKESSFGRMDGYCWTPNHQIHQNVSPDTTMVDFEPFLSMNSFKRFDPGHSSAVENHSILSSVPIEEPQRDLIPTSSSNSQAQPFPSSVQFLQQFSLAASATHLSHGSLPIENDGNYCSDSHDSGSWSIENSGSSKGGFSRTFSGASISDVGIESVNSTVPSKAPFPTSKNNKDPKMRAEIRRARAARNRNSARRSRLRKKAENERDKEKAVEIEQRHEALKRDVKDLFEKMIGMQRVIEALGLSTEVQEAIC